jgi:hypothetical protein
MSVVPKKSLDNGSPRFSVPKMPVPLQKKIHDAKDISIRIEHEHLFQYPLGACIGDKPVVNDRDVHSSLVEVCFSASGTFLLIQRSRVALSLKHQIRARTSHCIKQCLIWHGGSMKVLDEAPSVVQ